MITVCYLDGSRGDKQLPQALATLDLIN
jgi:hypothetical protein